MKAWKEFQEANKERFLTELLDLLRIPSVSAKSEHNGDMIACAQAVAKSLTDAGAQVATIYETEGHPIVYGEIIADPSFPTVLVYGHYDVQPADPLELWNSGHLSLPLLMERFSQEVLVMTRDNFICM